MGPDTAGGTTPMGLASQPSGHVARQTEMVTQIEHISLAIEKAQGAFQTLFERLQPVMNLAERPQTDKKEEPVSPSAKIPEVLFKKAIQIEELTSSIREVISRLEV